MKRILQISAFAIIAFAIVSCESLGITAPKMDSKDAVNRVIESYKKHIDTDQYRPVSLFWYEREELSNDLNYLSVTMISKEDNKLYEQVLKVGGDNQGPNEISEYKFSNDIQGTFETAKWIQPSDINPDLLVGYIDNAKEQIPDGYEFKSVYNFQISYNNSKSELQTSFTLRIVEKGNATNIEGKRIVTTYYELDFNVTPDGTVEMKE